MSFDATLILGALTVVSGVVGILFKAYVGALQYHLEFVERQLERCEQSRDAWKQTAQQVTHIADAAVETVTQKK
jgi:hypothetical protein